MIISLQGGGIIQESLGAIIPLQTAEGSDQARMAAIAAGERQVAEQLRHALIEDGAVVAAGLVAEGAGEPTLADAGRAARIKLSWASIQSPAMSFWNSGAVEPRAAR